MKIGSKIGFERTRIYHEIMRKMKIKLSNRAANKIARKQRRINRLNKK